MSIQSEINRISGNVANALTAIANKGVTVPQGSNSDDLATLIAQISGGGTGAISIVDTPDAAGGTVRTITAVDISDTTAAAADVAQGKYFYTAAGVKTAGTASGGGGGGMSTQTGTFTGSGGLTAQILCNSAPDEIYVYGDLSGDPSLRGVISLTILKDIALLLTSDTSQSSTQENMSAIVHGISGYNENNQSNEPYASYSNGVLTLDMAESTSSKRFASGIAYSYKLISYSGATQHTIHLEFSDNTDTDIEVDYDDALIGTMITAYQPTGDWIYNNKIVDSAALDNVTWYTRPTETWETVLESDAVHINPGNPYGDIWISDLGSVSIPVGSVWRITIDGDSYVVTATGNGIYSSPYNGIIGNPLFVGGTDDGSDVPLCLEQNPWSAWSGSANAELSDDTDHTVKIERQVTA